jgi:hypothetical protein
MSASDSGQRRVRNWLNHSLAWLRWDEEVRQHKVHEERAEIVRTIFEKAVQGWGQHKIAHWLNERGVPTWGGASHWHRSYVKRILTNPAVIGTFTPHQKLDDGTGNRRRKPLNPIENYFPAAVEREMFDTVALRFATIASRGRHANRAVRSLFAGVLKCSRCGSTVSRVSKGDHVYLVCAKANSRAGTHQYEAVRYALVERAFRGRATGLIADAPRTSDTDLEELIERCRINVDVSEMSVHELVRELVYSKSNAVRERLSETETELEQQRDELRELLARRDALAPERVERKLQALLEALKRKPFDVAAVNAAIRQAIRRIVMDVQAGELQIFWQHITDDADPQAVSFPTFQRVPGGFTVSTQRRQRRGRKTVDSSSAAE